MTADIGSLVRTEEALFEIIHSQSGIIDELFKLAAQHMTVEEMEPLANSIKGVADKAKELEDIQ